MVFTISPLEMLAAFVLAYLGGILWAMAFAKYVDRVRRLAVCEAHTG